MTARERCVGAHGDRQRKCTRRKTKKSQRFFSPDPIQTGFAYKNAGGRKKTARGTKARPRPRRCVSRIGARDRGRRRAPCAPLRRDGVRVELAGAPSRLGRPELAASRVATTGVCGGAPRGVRLGEPTSSRLPLVDGDSTDSTSADAGRDPARVSRQPLRRGGGAAGVRGRRRPGRLARAVPADEPGRGDGGPIRR